MDELRHYDVNWDAKFIMQLFGEDEAKVILKILVGSMEHEDILIWHYTKDGEYTVKSGYKTTMVLKEEVECSNPAASLSWWRSLWKLKVPLKVKKIVWRVCRD